MHFCCWGLVPVQVCGCLLILGWWKSPSALTFFQSLFTFSTIFLIFIISLLFRCLFLGIFWNYSISPSIPFSTTFWTFMVPFWYGISISQSPGWQTKTLYHTVPMFFFSLLSTPFSVKPNPLFVSGFSAYRWTQGGTARTHRNDSSNLSLLSAAAHLNSITVCIH